MQARPVDWNTAAGGNAARTGHIDVSGPDTPNILWQGAQISEIAQPAVVHGRISVTTRVHDLDDTLHGSMIVASDLRSGRVLWSRELPVDSPVTDWRVRVVAAHRGLVFATRTGDTNVGALYALRLDTGAIAWRSAQPIDSSAAESPAITPDGDLIVGNYRTLVRIRGTDGTTVWTTQRLCPSSDSGSPALAGGRIFAWEASPNGPRIAAFNALNGRRLFASQPLGPGIFQQMGLMVGPGPVVYAPRADGTAGADTLVALCPGATGFTEIWRVPMAHAPLASLAVGPDGSVYSFDPSHALLRLDSGDGHVIARTAPIETDHFQPRIAIDRDGNLYLTTGGVQLGSLQSFSPNLEHRWTLPTPGVSTAGPALAAPGILLLSASGRSTWAIGSHLAACGADWNSDTVVDARDFIDFLKAFFEGEADFNADGVTNTLDLFDFLDAFTNGC